MPPKNQANPAAMICIAVAKVERRFDSSKLLLLGFGTPSSQGALPHSTAYFLLARTANPQETLDKPLLEAGTRLTKKTGRLRRVAKRNTKRVLFFYPGPINFSFL